MEGKFIFLLKCPKADPFSCTRIMRNSYLLYNLTDKCRGILFSTYPSLIYFLAFEMESRLYMNFSTCCLLSYYVSFFSVATYFHKFTTKVEGSNGPVHFAISGY